MRMHALAYKIAHDVISIGGLVTAYQHAYACL